MAAVWKGLKVWVILSEDELQHKLKQHAGLGQKSQRNRDLNEMQQTQNYRTHAHQVSIGHEACHTLTLDSYLQP